MKSVKVAAIFLLMTFFISSYMVIQAFADGLEGKEINLPDLSVSGPSDYKIVVQNFIEIKTVKEKLAAKGRNGEERYQDITVIVMDMPQKDSQGNYPFFELVTTDQSAQFISSSVNVSNYDGHDKSFYMAGYQKANFTDGKVVFSPSFKGGYKGSFEKEVGDLKDTSADTIFVVDMHVFNQSGEGLFSMTSDKLKFMFVNKSNTTSVPEKENVTPKKPMKSEEATASSSQELLKVNVTIDGEPQNYEQSAVIKDGSSLVPLRGIFEAFGAEVKWNNDTQIVTATKGTAIIQLKVGAEIAKINNRPVQLAAKAEIINGNTMVPLRFVSEALGANVQWDQATRTAIISSPK